MKKFGQEFKKFIMRGNVLDLAVGVIIGAAFQAIVSSLINDILMPFIGLITGGANFQEQFAILKLPEGVTKEMVTSLDVAKELGVTTINYGSFIAAIINFILMAIVVFLIVKSFNKAAERAKKKKEAEEKPAEPTTKVCPFCQSEISIKATRCPHCTSELPKDEE